MEQVRIVRKGRKANDRWLPEHREVLPLAPRDPDITRAKELNKNGYGQWGPVGLWHHAARRRDARVKRLRIETGRTTC